MDQTSHAVASGFFSRYRRALLDRDVAAVAAHYGCPALIAFPGSTVAVTDPRQTQDFFAVAMSQYDGVTDATAHLVVRGEGPGSIWADVTWTYDGAVPSERLCYQLLDGADGWRIGVLTPLAT